MKRIIVLLTSIFLLVDTVVHAQARVTVPRRVPAAHSSISHQFNTGDVIYIPRAGGQLASYSLPPFSGSGARIWQNHIQVGEAFTLLYYRAPGVWLGFNINLEDISFVGRRSNGQLVTFPSALATAFPYVNIQCAYYIRTSNDTPVETSLPLPRQYPEFISSLISGISILPELFLSSAIQGMSTRSLPLDTQHALFQPQFREGIYSLSGFTPMTQNNAGPAPAMEYQRAALIHLFSTRIGFFPIRNVFRAQIDPSVECPTSGESRALYPIEYGQLQTNSLSRMRADFPWFFRSTETARSGAPIGAPIPWNGIAEDVGTAAQATGMMSLLWYIVSGFLAADAATSR